MKMIIFWIFTIFIIDLRWESAGASMELTILNTNPSGYLIRREGDELNITCVLNSTDGPSSINAVKIEWSIDGAPFKTRTLHESYTDIKSSSFLLHSPMESDSGIYVCKVVNKDAFTTNGKISEPILEQANVTVRILPKKDVCKPPFFQCTSGECIASRYVCDGVLDCRDESDEHELHCGPQPCKGKIYCDNNRCQLFEVCCAFFYKASCEPDSTHACCQKSEPQILRHGGELLDHQYRNLSFLGLDTIIGCAVAFMFVITVIVVAVCRVHMKQTAMIPNFSVNSSALLPFRRTSRWNRRVNDPEYLRRTALFRERLQRCPPPSTSLMVTYNINNGVQLVGHLAEPPPYSEVVGPPPSYGPPPPYTSVNNNNLNRELPTPPSTVDTTGTTTQQLQVIDENAAVRSNDS